MQKHAFCCLLALACSSTLLFTSCKKDGNGQDNGNTEDLSGRYYIATAPINTDRERRYLLTESVIRDAEGRRLVLSYHSSLADVVDTVYVWTVEKLANGLYAIHKIGHNVDSKSRVYWSLGQRNNPVLPTAIQLSLVFQEDMADQKPGPGQQFKLEKTGTGQLRVTTTDGKPPIYMFANLVRNGVSLPYYELYGLYLDDTQPSCMWKMRDADSLRFCFVEGVSFRK